MISQWIQCHTCNGWSHQICSLYDSRMQKDEKEKFKCPICHKNDLKKVNENLSISHIVKNLSSTHLSDHSEKIPTVKNLPSTQLSNHLEKRLSHRLEEDKKQRAQQQSKSYDEVIFYLDSTNNKLLYKVITKNHIVSIESYCLH